MGSEENEDVGTGDGNEGDEAADAGEDVAAPAEGDLGAGDGGDDADE